MRRARRRITVALALGLFGCAAPQYANQPLAPGATPNPEAAPIDVAPGRPAILMAFSGGGSRAAALSLSVLQELRRYGDGAAPRRLIDDVAVVSSVSGGSVTAGYFGLYGPDGIDRLVPDFLARDNMATLELTGANPVTWLRLVFGNYTRIDALRDLFDRQLFQGKTFADMPGRPFVILNASDMGSGAVFSFTGERFNDICSDLRTLPVSVGVAASAAFPVLLSPVDLKNHSVACPTKLPDDSWIATDLTKRVPRYLNVEEYKLARYADTLRRPGQPGVFRNVEYLHLLDGGLSDNLGIHALLDAVVSPHGAVRLLRAINDGKLDRLAVVTVNARSDTSNSVDQDAHTPGVVKVIGSVVANPIDAATASLAAQLRGLLGEIERAARDAADAHQGDPLFKKLRVYNIEIDFDQFLPEQAGLRDTVKAIPTLWTVTPDQITALNDAGVLLLRQHPCFQKLLIDLGSTGPFQPDPAFANAACPQQ